MQRQALIIFTVFMTLGTVMSAEFEQQPVTEPLSIEQNLPVAESHAIQYLTASWHNLSVGTTEPDSVTVSLKPQGECQAWSRQIELDFDADQVGRVVEMAARYLLKTQSAASF